MPAANAATFTADGWLRTGDLGLVHEGELYITGRAKEIIFVNGQNYYPHDLESIAQRADGLELGKVVAAGVRPRGRADRAAGGVRAAPRRHDGFPAAGDAGRRASSTSRPGSKWPRWCRSSASRRPPAARSSATCWKRATSTASSTRSSRELRDAARRAARAGERRRAAASRSSSRPSAMPRSPGKRVDLHDNLFEIGASSLKLIEIHEQIDREYPGRSTSPSCSTSRPSRSWRSTWRASSPAPEVTSASAASCSRYDRLALLPRPRLR